MSGRELMQASDEQIVKMQNILGKSNKEVADYLRIIRTWIRQNPHLPDIESDVRLIKFIQLNKYHLEKVKMKLDNYYTLRNLIPEIFENRHPLHPSMQNLLNIVTFIPVPRLTEDFARVHIIKFLNDDPTIFNPYDFFKLTIVVAEMRLMYDHCLGDHFVFDFSNTKLGHFIKVTPMMLKHSQTIMEKALSDRMQGLHYINAPSYALAVINLSKTVFKEKLAKRIHVHKDLSSLHDMISKKVLPADYGGDEKSVQELQDLWKKFLADHNDWFLKEGRMSTNEKLRPTKIVESDILGYQGSFRKLDLD